MMELSILLILTAFYLVNSSTCPGSNDNETEAVQFLRSFNVEATACRNALALKNWDMVTNITDYNINQFVELEIKTAKFAKDMRAKALEFNSCDMSENTRRQLTKIKDIGTAAEPDETKYQELAGIVAQMMSMYNKAKVCLATDICWSFEPDIRKFFATSRDYDTLLTLWVGWRTETGRNMRDLYTRYVDLSNNAVKHLGYKDLGEQWRSAYESDTFADDVRDLFDQVRPLFEQLHAYVRRRLKQVYGENNFPKSGHIPAHILGDMWGQQWGNLIDLVKPFENKHSMDVTEEMIRQNYTVNTMFRTAENFFTSLGFKEMVPTFWTKSMFEKPQDGRKVACHPTAWDLYGKKDFSSVSTCTANTTNNIINYYNSRISMCTVINQEDFEIIHHEMGHIQYFMQYRKQPFVYRDGANPGFHEAIGDVMELSVKTPEHMKKLGLIENVDIDEEADMNFLMSRALQKVAFLPFGYLIDKWRWSVFRGDTPPETYNKDWWALRCQLQGVSPPVKRSEADFDPASKFHVSVGATYIRYFVSFIIQFQFHKALCQAAEHTGPLHRCDIYNNIKAGRKLRRMLKLGASRPWPEVMKLFTGQEKMDASALLEYFQPLMDFLTVKNGNDYGWDPECPVAT